MEIKTVGQLKNVIADIDDDFELAISLRELVPEEELSKREYKFPYPKRRKTPNFSYGDIRRVRRIYVSN